MFGESWTQRYNTDLLWWKWSDIHGRSAHLPDQWHDANFHVSVDELTLWTDLFVQDFHEGLAGSHCAKLHLRPQGFLLKKIFCYKIYSCSFSADILPDKDDRECWMRKAVGHCWHKTFAEQIPGQVEMDSSHNGLLQVLCQCQPQSINGKIQFWL